MADSFHKVFLTVGAGFIATHTCVKRWYSTIFCISHYAAFTRMAHITCKKLTLVQGEIRDSGALDAALRASASAAVIHFAGHKSVGELVQKPLAYYDNNVAGSLSLLQAKH